jgi:hypothetical protein
MHGNVHLLPAPQCGEWHMNSTLLRAKFARKKATKMR